MNFHSEFELLQFTQNIIGKKFYEIDRLGLLNTKKGDKGILGKIVETGFYGYCTNSNSSADFESLGIELKVSGFVVNKDKSISAKERLVLSMINYHTIVNETFEFSKLLFKNKKLLIIWYEYEKDKDPSEFEIKYYQLYDMSQDELIFKNDFYLIQSKIIDGKAHLLSGGDTSYLGACPKGANKNDTTSQPNSDIPAMKRAFELKNRYMTGVLRNINNSQIATPIEFKTVEEYVTSKLKQYFGLTQKEIYKRIYNIELNTNIPKNLSKMISDKIIGKDSELSKKHDLFNKTTYIIKNIPINQNNQPLERLTFRNLVLSEFTSDWDESNWKNYFEEVTLILICYEGNNKDMRNGDRILKEIKKITFTSDDIKLFETSYDMIRQAIKDKDIRKLPYPAKFSEPTLVIAPKGNRGDDAYNNFFKQDNTKTCFMIDKEFVYNKIK